MAITRGSRIMFSNVQGIPLFFINSPETIFVTLN